MKMNTIDPGWPERTVRFLIGLPTATAYFYSRHFSVDWAYVFLGIGLAIMMTGLRRNDPHREPMLKPGNVASAPSLEKFAHVS